MLSRQPYDLQSLYGAQNLLDDVYRAWSAGRFSAADLVGPCRHRPNTLHLLVGRLPQRVVLNPGLSAAGGLRHGEGVIAGGVAAGTAGQRPSAHDHSAA